MDTGLTFASLATLFGAMVVLAAVPSISVLAISARAAASGFRHGAATALGVVAGDAVLVLVAVFGLVLLVDTLGDLFVLVMLLGSGYLIWLGVTFWRTGPGNTNAGSGSVESLLSSFTAGLLITLGDQKALLFYFGFFPAFVDLQALTAWGIALILAATLLGVGSVKLIYAWLAHGGGALLGPRLGRGLHRLAGIILVVAGALLLGRSLLSFDFFG